MRRSPWRRSPSLQRRAAHRRPGGTTGAGRWPTRRGRRCAATPATPPRARFAGATAALCPGRSPPGGGSSPPRCSGPDGEAYVGSADGRFYALDERGRRIWSLRTGGVIDAAAALGARSSRRSFPITIGSGDETLYQLRSDARRLDRERRIRWAYRTELAPATGQLVNWWEGNPAYGPDGNLYVGNTGGGAFSLTPEGALRWVVQRANSVWTTPAFDAAGNSYWGSVDFYAFSLDPLGALRWQTFTPGYVTSSPALDSDGTVYVGSFDRSLHALDSATGQERWAFPTTDHIYASPALATDASGTTRAIYIGSADGSVYAVRPDGSELWRYETGDPVRSSPVIGRAAHGGGEIVYVGSSNGVLYALDAETGRRRWSFDTSMRSGPLADRDDLNGSPALGRRGVYIGGEHGRVWFVPYDYCRVERDVRCSRSPGQEFPDDLNRVLTVTPGGTTRFGAEKVPAATVLAMRLVVRRGGVTLDARIDPDQGSGALVRSRPRFDFQTQLSGDGHYIFVRPDRALDPGTAYRLRVAGGWRAGSETGDFDSRVRIETAEDRGDTSALRVRRRRVGALELTRLALPLPALLPSVNQIGFDSYDLIAGTVAKSHAGAHRGRITLWVIGARTNARGVPVADPGGGFAFPLHGRFRHDQLVLNASGLNLRFSFGDVPLRSFDVRGALRERGGLRPGPGLYGQVTCADVPNYSAELRIAGVCNQSDTLASYGTLLSDRYDDRGTANLRPPGVSAGPVTLTAPAADADGEVAASLRLNDRASLPADRHLVSILLVDRSTGTPVGLDYRGLTAPVLDGAGNVVGARLRIPAGTELPATLEATTIVDVFPLGRSDLSPRARAPR